MRAISIVVGLIVGCTPPLTERTADPVDGVEELAAGLADLTSQCAFASEVVTLTLEPDDIGWLALGSAGVIEINGLPCDGATVSATKRIQVNEGGTGDQTLILDHRFGALGLGRAQGPGLVVALGGGTDELKMIGSNANDRITIGALGLSFGNDTFIDVTFTGVEAVTVNLDSGADTLSGGGDAVTGAAFPNALALYGGTDNDTLRGGAGADTCNGGDGDDTLAGGTQADGGDTLIGGLGRDTADYGLRTASLSLSKDGAANDGATNENDNISADIEVIKGGTAADTLTGGAAADTLYGGGGDDAISGGDSGDTMYGDAGNDTFDEGSAVNGADTIDGGTGTDTVTYASRPQGVTIQIDGEALSGSPSEGDRVLESVEIAIGGDGNDTIHGGTAANVLDGGNGNDMIYGGGGNDRLRGGAGTNALYGEAGDDTFEQGASALGADTLVGGLGVDTADYSARTNDLVIVMNGVTSGGETGEGDVIGADVEGLLAGTGADTITGNAGDNFLDGAAGIDALAGLAGDDVIDGGAGSDSIDCGSGDADISLDATTSSSLFCEL